MPETRKSTTSPRLTPSGPLPERARAAVGVASPHAEATVVAKGPHAPTIARHTGTYVADTYTGDAAADAAALARDGEPIGLNRVTRAMRPAPSAEPPAPRRLVGLSAWAAAVGILGVILAAWSGIEWIIGAPKWFLTVASINGLIGVSLTVGAFFAARKNIVPWALLAGATLTLLFGILINLYAAQPVKIN